MAPEDTSRRWRSATYAPSIGLASASMAQTSSATAYSGQAYVVQATVPNRRQALGSADIDGKPASYEADVADNGETAAESIASSCN